MGGNGKKNIHQLVMEKIEKDGPRIALEWQKEYERNRALLEKRKRAEADQAEDVTDVITKKCTKCGEVKALDAFSANRSRKDGKCHICKTCTRKYREENKGLLSEYGRKYYGENKERLKEQMRKYQKENPDVYQRAQHKRRAFLRNLPHQPLTPQQYEILHRQKYEIFGGIASGN